MLLTLIINIVFILFPSLLYNIYIANKQNLKEEENKILLDLSLIVALLLIILYSKVLFVNNLFIYPLIVLLFSLLNNRIASSVIIAFISFDFITVTFDFNSITIVSLLIGIIALYFIFKKNQKKFVLISFIYSTIILFIAFKIKGDFNYLSYCINVVLFYLIIQLLMLWIKKSKEILELQNILKEYKNQSLLKESLFKITHEIKNPLAVVKGYLSMVDLKKAKKSKEYLKIINGEIERTINLLEDFMKFRIKLAPTTFEFNFLLEEIKAILTPLFAAKNVFYEFKSENNILICGDYNRLKQVIINIIKNSVEASKKNNKVLITCFKSGNNLNIVIKDNGVGMSKETLTNLFTPFYTTKEMGTGLGICLSKEIIEAHKGKIIYYSSLGKGTTAKITLPILN